MGKVIQSRKVGAIGKIKNQYIHFMIFLSESTTVFHHAYKVVVNDIELVNLINFRNDQVLTRYKDQSIKIT